MRVLILDRSWGNPYSRGLAAGLRANGLEVKVAGPVGSDADIGGYPPAVVGVPKWRKAPAAAAGLARLTAVAASWQPDVIHVQWQEPIDAALLKAVRRVARGAAVVLTVHNPTKRVGDEGSSESLAAMLEQAQAVVVHGPLLARAFADRHPTFEGKVEVVEHGNYAHVVSSLTREESRHRLGIEKEERVVAFFGQIRRRKGIEDLITAVSEISPSPLLVIGGAALDDEYLDTLVARAAGAQARVRWLASLEPISQRDLDSVVAAADVVALPFLDASQSGSVIFAMTRGACVVTTAVGELPRTLDGRGLVVQPADPEELRGAISRCLSDPEFAARLGGAAAQYSEIELDWSVIGRQMAEAVYGPLLANSV